MVQTSESWMSRHLRSVDFIEIHENIKHLRSVDFIEIHENIKHQRQVHAVLTQTSFLALGPLPRRVEPDA